LSSNRKWTIAIRPSAGESLRKITKIIGLNGDGFSVLAPYHQARSGFLFKHLVDLKALLRQGTRLVAFEECEGFTAENRAKLTYHVDGFAQFSSEGSGKIISGRDPKTGEPKGLGLFTHPLSTPIVTGPSAGVTVWGMEDFESVRENESLVTFEPKDVYYRDCLPKDANTWHLAIHAFAVRAIPPLQFEGDQAVMQYQLHSMSGVPGAVIRLKVIHLQAERVYLGLYVERFIGKWPSKSGWSLGGPGNFTLYQSGYGLRAVYPRDVLPVDGRASLDWTPSTPADTGLASAGTIAAPAQSKTQRYVKKAKPIKKPLAALGTRRLRKPEINRAIGTKEELRKLIRNIPK
jgi:hypothetical protein